MGTVIGIDLGTTFSCVAYVKEGVPTVIPNKGGYKTTPSIVAYTESGKRLVGHVAKRQAITNAEHTVFAAKRLIGRRWGSDVVERIAASVPYKLVAGPNNDVCVELRGRVYAIPEISSQVLQEMKLIAEAHLNENVTQSVITVPAYFNDNQRQATRDAGTIAGMEILRIINEPTAAALAYGYGKGLNKRAAVYDLGGGTFDISILDIKGEDFKVIATAGDSFLGGEDFDARLVDYLNQRFMSEHGIDLKKDPIALQRLKEAAEKAKCDLSTLAEVEVSLPFIATKAKGEALHMRYVVTRAEFESLVEDLIDKTLKICQKALQVAGVLKASVNDVLLVGGQTRTPRVQFKVKEFFGVEPSKRVHPDEAVALGAAIQGHSMASRKAEVTLLDVTPQSLGIMIAGGYVTTIIEKNTAVPTRRGHIFTTVKDNQTQVKIMILQGEGEKAEENELLGEFVLDGLREGPRGSVEIEVTFSIDADGIVSVSAKDTKTGLQQAITVTARSGLTDEEIRRMAEENRDYLLETKSGEEFDRLSHTVCEMLDEIEKVRPSVEKALTGDKDFAKDVLGKADALKVRAKKAVESKDLDGVIAVNEPLQRTLNMFRSLTKGGGGTQ
jgi:molecular chaperone DnaK